MIRMLLTGMHVALGIALITALVVFPRHGHAAKAAPTAAYKAALVEAFESGSDTRVRRNLVTVYRRAVVRNPQKVSAFARLLVKATKGFGRRATQQENEEFLTGLSVATMKGYYKQIPRFDAKVEGALTDLFRIVNPGAVSADFTDRLYLRLLPIHLKTGEDPRNLQEFLKNPWGIIFD